MHKIDQVEPFDNIVRETLWYIYYLRFEGGQYQLNDLYEMLDIEGVVNIDRYVIIGLLINIQGMLYFW